MSFLSDFIPKTSPASATKKVQNPESAAVIHKMNWRRLEDRQIDELIGMCKMAIGDGHVDSNEAKALMHWLEQNRESSERWPANVLKSRLAHILADGKIDREEEGELIDLLLEITGQPLDRSLAQMSTSLPLCKPPPIISFENKTFCFTGKFFLGPRKKCEAIVTERGGLLAGSPNKKTDFLIIGMIGSEDWIHSTHGRKIELAVKMREEGEKINIISEEYWTTNI